MKLYREYFWKNGVPCGRNHVKETESLLSKTFKIVMDPYKKNISLEEYVEGKFNRLIYHSLLLDFRHLNPASQTAWERELIEETSNNSIFLIRDQNDRVMYIEKLSFKDNVCKDCHIYSPQNILLSFHKMFYSSWGDPFDGLILFDPNGQPIMQKKYQVDKEIEDFKELLEENWDMEKFLWPN